MFPIVPFVTCFLGGGDGLLVMLAAFGAMPGGLGAKFGLPYPPTGGLLGSEGGPPLCRKLRLFT